VSPEPGIGEIGQALLYLARPYGRPFAPEIYFPILFRFVWIDGSYFVQSWGVD
jgi:hypothetical protein